MEQLQTTRLTIDGAAIYTAYLPAKQPRADGLTAVLLHGAGQASSERFYGLAEQLSAAGIPVVLLDFLGHGKTGGNVYENRLDLRTAHALAAIAHWTKPDTPLIVCGSSMSGHTALRVAATLGARVRSLCLLQPAVYAAEAETVPFTDAFTKILHTHGSWQSSLAFADARNFKGKAAVLIGTEDTVIPWGVIESLMNNLKVSAQAVRIDILRGVGHELPTWLPKHPDVCKALIDYLVAEI